MKFKPMPGKVFVELMKKGERIVNGIILLNDDGKTEGVRPRWCKVFAKADDVTDIWEGQWILVKHGRWSRSIRIPGEDGNDMLIWQVEHPDSTLLVSDEEPTDEFVN